jgi:hypothetical protein
MAMSKVLWRAGSIAAVFIAICGAGAADDATSITMKIGKTCGARYNELFVQVEHGPRVRVKPDLSVAVTVQPGTRLRVRQSEESASLKVDGIWTEAEDGGELLTRCLR